MVGNDRTHHYRPRIVCLFLIIVVLLQSGKSADIAAAFGGMGSQTAFGPRGAATVLSKATTWSAIIFMLTSITLSIFASRASTQQWIRAEQLEAFHNPATEGAGQSADVESGNANAATKVVSNQFRIQS